nr:hypothetical protein [uncultured Campylobacter sp.]
MDEIICSSEERAVCLQCKSGTIVRILWHKTRVKFQVDGAEFR